MDIQSAAAAAQSLDSTKGALEPYATGTAMFESVVTAIGIILAGVWTYLLFLKNRQKYPRAGLTHEVRALPFGKDGAVLVHITVRVQNLGTVLIELESGFMRLYAFHPANPDAPDLPNDAPYGFRISNLGEPCLPARDEHEFRWPRHANQTIGVQCEIEPGESEYYNYEVYLPARYRTIKVYSHLANVIKSKRKLGWSRTTVHQVEDLLKPPSQSAEPPHDKPPTAATTSEEAG